MPGGKVLWLWLSILTQVRKQPEERGLEHPWGRRMVTRVLLLGLVAESKDVSRGKLCPS